MSWNIMLGGRISTGNPGWIITVWGRVFDGINYEGINDINYEECI